MDEPKKPEPNSQLEQRLSRLYQTPSPDPGFTRRLEMQLDERASQMGATMPSARRSAWWSVLGEAARWGWGLAGMALLVAVIIFAFSLLPGRPSALPQIVTPQATATPAALLAAATPTQSLPAETAPSQAVIEPEVTPIPGVITYTVAQGDTLLAISEKFGVPVASLFELNQLETGDVLVPGMELLIAEVYRVVPGDTCASIAFSFGVSVEQLVQTNNLSPACDNLRGNQQLIIPVSPPEPALEQAYVLAKQAGVNLRHGPGTTYEVVGTISTGEKLLKQGDVTPDGWVPVEYPSGSGETAYVWVELVTVMDSSVAQQGVPAPADWVRLSNPRTLDEKLLVDVCFNLLDDGDWMIRDAILRYELQGEQQEIPYDSGTLISIVPTTANSEGIREYGERCDVLEFPLESGTVPESPVVSILSLQAYPREGQECELYAMKVQPLLTARDTGIVITCESVPHASGNINVIARPDEMSLEEAQAVVYQTFLDATSLRGTWEFDLAGILPEGSPIPNLEDQHPVLAELRDLNQLRSRTYFQGPGWVHLHSREIFEESLGTLPDGTVLPAEYQVDEWFELDGDGLVIRAVSRQLDLSGNILQVSVLVDGRWTNLTTRESWEQPPYELQPLDYAFSDLALSAAKTGKSLTKQSVNFEGNYVGDQYVIQDSDVRWESVFDPATGRQLSFITWQVLPEGLQLVSSVVIETLENTVSPPVEILELLGD